MKPRVALTVLLILILAAGTSYWLLLQQQPPTPPTITTGPVSTAMTQPPLQFAFFLGPPFFHVAPNQGRNITAFVKRASGFSAAVTVDVVSPPSWVAYRPVTIGPAATNGTLTVIATKDAPKTELNLTVRASSSGVADQFALLDMKVVGVSNVTSEFGSAVVYDTTKVLLGESLKALTGYTNDTLVFSAVTPQLQSLARGDVVIIPPDKTPLVKDGLMRMVISVNHQGNGIVVNTVPAGLLDEFQQLDIGNEANATSSSSMSPASFISPAGWYGSWWPIFDPPVQDFNTGVVNVGGDGADTFQATGQFWAGFGARLHVHWGSWCGCVPDVDIFFVRGRVEFTNVHLSLRGTKDTSLDWDNPKIKELAHKKIQVFGDFLWITLDLSLEGIVSGELRQNTHLELDTGFKFETGPSYDTDPTMCGGPGTDPYEQCDGWFMYKSVVGPYIALEGGYGGQNVDPGSGTDVKVDIGPRFEISVNAGLGDLVNAGLWGSLAADVYWELISLIPHKPSSWWIDGGVEAHAEMGVQFSALWGLLSWHPPVFKWGPWPILGPKRLMDGLRYPPMVTVISPQEGQNIDLSSGIAASGFRATATSPQDGNLCEISGATLIWTDQYGNPIGTDCDPQGVGFKQSGEYDIVFTATDTEGQTTSSAPIHIVVTAPKPHAYIINPTDGEKFTVGNHAQLIGGAFFPPSTDLPCSDIVFNIYPPSPPSVLNLATTPYQGPQCKANIPYQFDNAGEYKIELVATQSTNAVDRVLITVSVQLPANPQSPQGPDVEVYQPPRFNTYDSSGPIKGTIWSGLGNPQDAINYVWTASVGSNPPTTLGQDTLSGCNTQDGCPVFVTLDASKFCKPNIPMTVNVTLTAYQGSLSGKGSVLVTLDCAVVATPPSSVSVAWASWGIILPDRWLSSRSGWSRRLVQLLLRSNGIALGNR